MLTCREVSRDNASDSGGSAGIGRRLAVRFHLMMCASCRAFAREMELLGAAVRRATAPNESPTPESAAESRLIARLRGPIARGRTDDADSSNRFGG